MLENWVLQASLWLRPHMSGIAFMVVATLLVLYGNTINGMVKHAVRHYYFVVRVTIFILLCAFGYGLLTTILTPILATQLASLPNLYLSPVVVVITVALGILAERKRHL